jgi:hypothetical protein
MRISMSIVVALASLAGAAEPGKRHGLAADLKTYPQATPKEALASALKAIDARRFDYLLGQIADPTFIDEQVKRAHGGDFAAAVEDARARLDPAAVKLLRRFLKAGEWSTDKVQTIVRLEGVPDRCVRLRQNGGRWFLEHRWTPPAK